MGTQKRYSTAQSRTLSQSNHKGSSTHGSPKHADAILPRPPPEVFGGTALRSTNVPAVAPTQGQAATAGYAAHFDNHARYRARTTRTHRRTNASGQRGSPDAIGATSMATRQTNRMGTRPRRAKASSANRARRQAGGRRTNAAWRRLTRPAKEAGGAHAKPPPYATKPRPTPSPPPLLALRQQAAQNERTRRAGKTIVTARQRHRTRFGHERTALVSDVHSRRSKARVPANRANVL